MLSNACKALAIFAVCAGAAFLGGCESLSDQVKDTNAELKSATGGKLTPSEKIRCARGRVQSLPGYDEREYAKIIHAMEDIEKNNPQIVATKDKNAGITKQKLDQKATATKREIGKTLSTVSDTGIRAMIFGLKNSWTLWKLAH